MRTPQYTPAIAMGDATCHSYYTTTIVSDIIRFVFKILAVNGTTAIAAPTVNI
jgi:hypothetical protein